MHYDRGAIIELPKEPIELEMELAAIGIQENPKMIWIQDEDGQPVRVQLFSQSDRKNHAAGLFTADNTLEEVNQCAHLEMFVAQFLSIKLILAVLRPPAARFALCLCFAPWIWLIIHHFQFLHNYILYLSSEKTN